MNNASSLSALLASLAASVAIAGESATRAFKPDILKTWDDIAMASLEIPLAEARFSPKHITADYYYGIPVRPIFKSYAVYPPDQERSKTGIHEPQADRRAGF